MGEVLVVLAILLLPIGLILYALWSKGITVHTWQFWAILFSFWLIKSINGWR